MSPLGIIAAVWTATTAATLSVLTVAYHLGAGRERRELAKVPVKPERHLYLVR